MSDQPAFNFGGPIGNLNINASNGVQVNGGSGTNVNSGSGTLNVGGQNFGGTQPVERIFNDMVSLAKAEQPSFVADEEPSAPPEILAQFETPSALLEAARDEAVADLQAIEPLPIGQFEQKQATWQERFALIAPKVLKVAFAGGKAVLDSYVSQSPVIAGLKAMVTAVSD